MVPVLMLTAKGDEIDKVTGLRLGADDYLTKPFSINELTARMESLIRRYTRYNQPIVSDVPHFKNMVINKETRTVCINGEPVELTGKEFDLLMFLASNKLPIRGVCFRRSKSIRRSGEYAFDDNNIMSFISKLRKKIEPDPEHPFYILTVYGVGYRFNR